MKYIKNKMNNIYNVLKDQNNNYYFKTDSGLKYNIEMLQFKNSLCEIDKIFLFSFYLVDSSYNYNQDNKIGNTIIDFIYKKMFLGECDAIFFQINNELEPETKNKFRGMSRLKYFKRLMLLANQKHNINTIFLTNQHYILNPTKYRGDYLGGIIKINSQYYLEIHKIFNKFCYLNSYKLI